MPRRTLKLETRYAYLLRDAKNLTTMLELASATIIKAARRIEGVIEENQLEPSDYREMASECARIAHQCGRSHRWRNRR